MADETLLLALEIGGESSEAQDALAAVADNLESLQSAVSGIEIAPLEAVAPAGEGAAAGLEAAAGAAETAGTGLEAAAGGASEAGAAISGIETAPLDDLQSIVSAIDVAPLEAIAPAGEEAAAALGAIDIAPLEAVGPVGEEAAAGLEAVAEHLESLQSAVSGIEIAPLEAVGPAGESAAGGLDAAAAAGEAAAGGLEAAAAAGGEAAASAGEAGAAAAEAGPEFGGLASAAGEVTSALGGVSPELGEITGLLGQAQGAIGELAAGMSEGAVGITAGFASIGAVGAAAFGLLGMKGAEWADEMMHVMAVTGMSQEQAELWDNVLGNVGLGLDTVTTLGYRLSRQLEAQILNIQQGNEATGVQVEVMNRLGIAYQDAEGNLRPMGELLPEIFERLGTMDDKTQAVAISTQLFGRQGASLIPIIQNYDTVMGSAERQLREYSGGTVDATAASIDYHTKMQDISEQMEVLSVEVLPYFLIALGGVVKGFSDLVDIGADVVQFFKDHEEALASLVAVGFVVATAAVAALTITLWGMAAAVLALTWPVVAIAAAIAVLGVGIYELIKHWDDITAAVDRAREKFLSLPAPIQALVAVLGGPITVLVALGVAVNELVTHWEDAWLTIRKATESAVNAAIGAFNVLLHGIEQVINKIIDAWNLVPGHKDVAHIRIQIDPIDLTPIAQTITGLGLLGVALAQVGGAIYAANDDTALLLNRLDNASAGANVAAGSFTGLAAAAGGAGEALRPLDADLIALREDMRSVAEEGLAYLNAEITEEKNELTALGRELEIVNDYHDEAKEHVDALKESIADTTTEMNIWKNTALEGTKAFDDASFAFSESQDRIQLAINKVKLAVSQHNDEIERTGKSSVNVTPAVVALAKAIGYDLGGSITHGQMATEAINNVLDAAAGKMTELGLKASDVKLEERLELGPAQRELEELFNPKVEASFDEIVAGFTASASALTGLNAELVTWQGHLVESEALQKELKDLQADHQKILDDLTKAYSDLEANLSKVDPVIKRVWEARSGGVVKSIEDVFAAIDRGDKAAADQAMADAQKLFDELKSKFPETETGFLIPIEGILKTTQKQINVDISGMTEALVGPVSDTAGGVGKLLDPAVVTAQQQINIATWLKEIRDSHYKTVKGIYDDFEIACDYLKDIRESLWGIPSAQHGGAILAPGLVNVEAGESIIPPGGRGIGGGSTTVIVQIDMSGSLFQGNEIEARRFARQIGDLILQERGTVPAP